MAPNWFGKAPLTTTFENVVSPLVVPDSTVGSVSKPKLDTRLAVIGALEVVVIAALADDRLRAHTATTAAAQERMRMMVEVPWSYEMLPNWPIEAQFSCVWRLRLLSREVGHGREWIVRQATARGSPARGGA